MSRHKRHLNTLKKLYDAGWFIVMVKPAYRTGAAEVYLGMHMPSFTRQRFVHAENVSREAVRWYYTPPIRTGPAMFVLQKWKGEDYPRAVIVYEWGGLRRLAAREAKRHDVERCPRGMARDLLGVK